MGRWLFFPAADTGTTTPFVDKTDDFATNTLASNWDSIHQENSATATWSSGEAVFFAPAYTAGLPKGNLDFNDWNGAIDQAFEGDTLIAKIRMRINRASVTEVFFFDMESYLPEGSQPGLRFRLKDGSKIAVERDKLEIVGGNVTSSYVVAQDTWTEIVVRMDLGTGSNGRTRIWAKADGAGSWTSVMDLTGANMPVPDTTTGFESVGGLTPVVDVFQMGLTAMADTTQSVTMRVDSTEFKGYRGAASESLNPA